MWEIPGVEFDIKIIPIAMARTKFTKKKETAHICDEAISGVLTQNPKHSTFSVVSSSPSSPGPLLLV